MLAFAFANERPKDVSRHRLESTGASSEAVEATGLEEEERRGGERKRLVSMFRGRDAGGARARGTLGTPL